MMDRQVRRLGITFLALFVVLFVQVNYVHVFAADELANNPANRRLLFQEYNVRRGAILARDRVTVLAESRATEDRLRFLRTYPGGERYGHITGYYSWLYGRGGIERSYNDYLAGRAAELLPQTLVDEILNRPKRGATIVTTIDPRLQEVAAEALGSSKGAVVALDPRTGDVLALASNPTFDPAPLAVHDGETVRSTWKRLNDDPENPMLSNAAQELFPPGSTFKLVTLAAALESGMTPGTTFPNPPELDLPQTTNTLQNFGGSRCFGGAPRITLAQALLVSCNVTFGELGLELGAERLVNQAAAFGFNQQVAFDIPFAEGSMPPPEAFEEDLPGVAYSAIGQQSVASNPLSMAMIVSAIANGGVLMRPRLVAEIRDPEGRVLKRLDPEPFSQPVSLQTATQMRDMMVAVVDRGTATAAQIPGVKVAGKTGTAQHGGQNPHAWFVAFAPADAPRIAVAVVVLNGGDLGSEATGGRIAAPIAKAVIEAELGG